jgi:orotate phosphoribosyltransferase
MNARLLEAYYRNEKGGVKPTFFLDILYQNAIITIERKRGEKAMKSIKTLTWKKDADVIIGLAYTALIVVALTAKALGISG